MNALQVTVNGDVEAEVEKVTETLGELQFEEEEDENAFYTKVSFGVGPGMHILFYSSQECIMLTQSYYLLKESLQACCYHHYKL